MYTGNNSILERKVTKKMESFCPFVQIIGWGVRGIVAQVGAALMVIVLLEIPSLRVSTRMGSGNEK